MHMGVYMYTYMYIYTYVYICVYIYALQIACMRACATANRKIAVTMNEPKIRPGCYSPYIKSPKQKSPS